MLRKLLFELNWFTLKAGWFIVMSFEISNIRVRTVWEHDKTGQIRETGPMAREHRNPK